MKTQIAPSLQPYKTHLAIRSQVSKFIVQILLSLQVWAWRTIEMEQPVHCQIESQKPIKLLSIKKEIARVQTCCFFISSRQGDHYLEGKVHFIDRIRIKVFCKYSFASSASLWGLWDFLYTSAPSCFSSIRNEKEANSYQQRSLCSSVCLEILLKRERSHITQGICLTLAHEHNNRRRCANAEPES